MKFIFNRQAFEKQLKLFPEYPDSVEEIGHSYIIGKEVKEHVDKSNCKIKTWSDGIKFFDDNYDKYLISAIIEDDSDEYFYEMYNLDEEGKDLLLKFIKERNLKYDEEEFESLTDTDGLDDLNVKGFSHEEFLKWLLKNKEYVRAGFDDDRQERYYMTRYFLDGSLSEEKTIYRAMVLPSKLDDLEQLDYKGVGLYWSYDEDGAVAHGGFIGDTDLVIIANIEACDVNWEETLTKSLWELNDEREIELKDNWTIEVTGFKIETHHPIVHKLYNKNVEYLKSIGIESPYFIAKKPGYYEVKFKTPVIVYTS